MSSLKLPLALSLAAHAICLALLFLLPTKAPPMPELVAPGGIEVAFAPSLPKAEAPAVPEPPVQAETPPTPEAEPAPPQPEEPAAAIEPPPQEPVAEPEPAPPAPMRKPAVKPSPKPAVRRAESPQPRPAVAPAQSAPAAVGAPQTAYAPTAVPAPVPSTEVNLGYRALLSAWLEGHKRYPDDARQRGEEGRAVVRFAVDRSGRVVDFAVVKSSGYQDLDAAIEDMMRGAMLPPFPAEMTQPRIEVSVAIRFSLAR